MLKETLEEFQAAEPKPDFQENSLTATQLFYDFLFLLRDEQKFPNYEINQLSLFTLHLLTDGHITLSFYENTHNYNEVILNIDVDEVVETAQLCVPKNFVSEVAEIPERQIGVITAAMSQCRDYFCGKINGQSLEECAMRALAYEAEAINTLIDLAEKEKVPLNLSNLQIGLIIDKFPNGLADLDEQLWYPSPKYKSTFSPPAPNEPGRN